MDKNAMAITVLCSNLSLGENMKPIQPAEWSKITSKLREEKIMPADLLSMNLSELEKYFDKSMSQRIESLVGRSDSIVFEIDRYANIGINIVTQANKSYPKILKQKLGQGCPPLFYYVGNLALADNKCIGFVGSRSITEKDENFTKSTVEKVLQEGYTVVSGGAIGVDSVSIEASLRLGGTGIEYLCDSLIKKSKKSDIVKWVQEGRLLLLSVSKPDASFNTGMAMYRNRFIYTQSQATVVVRSDYQKGGTWAGSQECLKKDYCSVCCWDNKSYKGNQAIITDGATPIDEGTNWNYLLEELEKIEKPKKPIKTKKTKKTKKTEKEECEQLTLFGN